LLPATSPVPAPAFRQVRVQINFLPLISKTQSRPISTAISRRQGGSRSSEMMKAILLIGFELLPFMNSEFYKKAGN